MKTIIKDVCDAYLTRLSDGKLIYTAVAQLTSVGQTINQEPIRGGIGNGIVTILRTEKEQTITLRDAIFDSDWLEVTTGAAFEANTGETIRRSEKGLEAADNGGDIELTITGTPIDDEVIVINNKNEQLAATHDTGTVTITTGGVAGEIYTVLYLETSGSVSTLTLNQSDLSEKYSLQLSTIEYDVVTERITKNLFWQFDQILPASQFDIAFENGTNYSPELECTVIKPINSDTVGRIIEEDVAA